MMEEQKQELTPEERIAALEKIIVQQGLPIAQGDRRFKEVKSLIDDVLRPHYVARACSCSSSQLRYSPTGRTVR